MKQETKEIVLEGIKTKVQLIIIEEKDRPYLRRLYDSWKLLNKGMKDFKSRGINMPEGISEGAFCLDFNDGCARTLKVSKGLGSFDVLELETGKRIQIKAVSVDEDLTSFGPKSVWDELYFLDFYLEGKFDGSFAVYKIPNNLIYDHKVNSSQTFKEQQAQGRRPRFSIKKILKEYNIKPIKICKI